VFGNFNGRPASIIEKFGDSIAANSKEAENRRTAAEEVLAGGMERT
jgi:hypothetical protein